MTTPDRGDAFAHSMTDLMAGVAVTFLLVAAIFMVQARAGAKEAEKELEKIESTATKAKSALEELEADLRASKEVIDVIYDRKRDPLLLTIVFNRGLLQFEDGQCDIAVDKLASFKRSFKDIFESVCKTATSGLLQSVTLEGHTDNAPFLPQRSVCGVKGTACRREEAKEGACKSVGFENNVRLSAARAQDVFFKLRNLLADSSTIAKCLDTTFVVAGRGPTAPVNGSSWEDEQDERQKEANRRVIIRIRAVSPLPVENAQ